MIPFNQLGFLFDRFGKLIYPVSVRHALCDFLKALPTDAKVVDIGAGTGLLCEFAYQCRGDLVYYAIDPAAGMLKYAKSYIKTYKATAEALPFEESSCDAVIMGESLHHFRDIDLALAETVRILKQGGKLFIYDFDIATFKGKSVCRVEKFLGEPGHFFTPESLKQKLKSYGFEVSCAQHGWRYTVDAVKV